MQAIEVIAESVELIEMTVNHAGSPVSAFEACLRPIGERPAGWVAAEVIGGRRGFLTPGDLDRGAYFLWARATQLPEVPVLLVAKVTVK